MKSKILSFVLLLCAGTVFSQTIINYPLEKNLNYSYAEPGTLPHTIGYGGSTTTPDFYNNFGGWLIIQENNDYIELTFQRNGYDELSVEYEIGIWAWFGTADFNLYWMNGATPVYIGTDNVTSLLVPVSRTITRALPAGALANPTVTIRISGSAPVNFGGVYGLRHLKINSKDTSLSVKRNNPAFPVIPYNSEASAVYDTDFGSLLTMEEHETKEFVIRNTGSKNDLKIDHFEIIQSGNDFSFEGSLPNGTTTSPNGTQTFKIRFEPQDQGLKVAEIRIFANILPNNPFVFRVIGYGKSCNLMPVPIATQHFETSPQNLDYTQIGTGNLKLINGTSSSHTPASVPNLNPTNQNLYVTGATSGAHGTSWYVRGDETGEVTLEFGEPDVSNQQEVSIYFEVAAFGTNNSNTGVNNSDYVILSLWDEANNSWSEQIRLNGANNGTRRRYGYGGSSYTKTTITPSVQQISNGNSGNYGKIEQKIPASFIPASGKLKFRIKAKTGNNNGLWLIDNVQVKAGNAIAKVWNGSSWPDGKPGEREKALFDGNYDFSGSQNVDLKICECEVNDGKNLTIPNGRTLTVRNKVINHGDGNNFVVKDGGNLIQIENAAANTGDIKVEKNFNFSPERKQYNYVTSPVVSSTYFMRTSIYNPNPPSLQKYDTASDHFYESMGAYIPGLAYAVKEPESGNDTGKFIGKPFNGVLNYSLNTSGNRYNLIGNPYPSNLDILLLYYFNNTKLENGNFYFWDNRNNTEFIQQGSGYSGVQYAMYNAVSDTGNPAPTNDQPGIERIPDRFVKVGTGFIIQASEIGGTLDFNNSYRTSEGDIGFFGKGFTPETQPNRYWLSMDTPGGMRVTNAVVYFEGGNDAFAIDDTETFLGSDDLFTFADEKALAIQGKASFQINDKVPLGYKAFKEGTHIISVFKTEGIFAEAQNIYLVDKLLNKTVNLSAKPYKFLTRAGQYNDRFEIIYKNKNTISTAQGAVEPHLISVTRQSEDLLIMSKGDKLSEVIVYNLLGRPVFTYKNLNTEELRIPAAEYSKQILIVNVVTQSGRTVSQKVIPK